MSAFARARQILADYRMNRKYRNVFSTPDGQDVMHDLLRRCAVLEVPQVDGAPDRTSFNIGRQSIGLEILEAMRMQESSLLELATKTGDTELQGALESVRSTL